MSESQICIRDKFTVEAIDENGKVIAKASRAEIGSTWFVGKVIDGKMTTLIEIHGWTPEHLGRHLVFAAIGAMIP